MHAPAFFATLVCYFAFVVNGHLVNVDQISKVHFYPRRHPSSSVNADTNPLTHARALASLKRVNPARRLTQASDDACAWDTYAEQCFLTAGTVIDFLSAVDNPLANYLQRAIVCELQLDEDDCRRENCVWSGFSCYIPHEEFREFTSAPCLEEVRHIVDLQANFLQCAGMKTRDRCEAVDACTWNPDIDFCVFDYWIYFHDIPMTDMLPEGYDEIVDELVDHLAEEIDRAAANGDIVNTSDLLDFEPSEFECPQNTDQMLCDYVNAYTPARLANYYCGVSYPEPIDQYTCSTDSNCQTTLDPDFPCEVADAISIQYAIEQGQIFAEAIEDPEARKYIEESFRCGYILNEGECDGNCVWTRNFCFISPKWAEEEAHRLIGETDNVVCQFYRSDVETGCLSHETVDDCTEDRQCVWLGDFYSCESGLYAWMDIALSGSDVEGSFKDTETMCFDSSIEECSADAEEDDIDNEYTYLSGGIGANMTIVFLFF